MAHSQGYEVPLLTMEEMISSFHSGTLGELASNITAEHLKNPMPAVMMQLCLSILEKVGVEVDTLCHPQIHSSMEMQNTDLHINSFKILHVTALMKKILPQYGVAEFQVKDITSPTAKQVRRFISAAVNYIRSWDTNIKAWDEIYAKTEESMEEHHRLNENINALTIETDELELEKEEDERKLKEMKETNDKICEELKELHQIKEEKLQIKEELKKKYSDLGSALEKQQKQMKELNDEKENLLRQVVGSPKRAGAKKQSLEKKMKLLKETHTDWQAKVDEAEKKNLKMESVGQHLSDILVMIDDVEEINGKKKELETAIQVQKYDTGNLELSLVGLSQDTTNIRQQIGTFQEKSARLTTRHKQRNIECEKTLQALKLEKETLESEASVVHKNIKDEEAEMKNIQKTIQERSREHEKNMENMKEKQKYVMEAMDQYHTSMGKKLRTSGFLNLKTSNE